MESSSSYLEGSSSLFDLENSLDEPLLLDLWAMIKDRMVVKNDQDKRIKLTMAWVMPYWKLGSVLSPCGSISLLMTVNMTKTSRLGVKTPITSM